MPVVSLFKRACWFSVAVAVLLFIGLLSIIIIKTNNKSSQCNALTNATKFDVLKCKGELAYDSSKETMESLFNFYDENTNITGTQQTKPPQKRTTDDRRIEKKTISPETHVLTEYEPFLKCLTDVNCGIVSKCAYDIEYKTTNPTPTPIGEDDNTTDTTAHTDAYMTNVYGSLYIIKNYVPYIVDYYWIIIGDEEEIKKQHGNTTLHKVRMQANSALYIDTRIVSKHHVKVYFDERQTITTDGVRYQTNLLELPNLTDDAKLNGMSTITSPGVECQKYQACKYLSGVCFANNLGGTRCYKYQEACKFFYDSDRSVKDYELVDYFYTYYPSCIPPNATINPNEISDWVCRGGGISGSGVGTISSTPVIVLSLLLCASIVAHVTIGFSYYKFKRTINNTDYLNDHSTDNY